VAVDGSPPADEALAFAVEEWPTATLVLLHVINPVEAGYSATAVGGTSEDWFDRERGRADALFDEARDAIGDDPDVETVVEVGRPARTIVGVADEQDADHVVVGSHGRTGVARILLGSVAERVVRTAPVPVTVVR